MREVEIGRRAYLSLRKVVVCGPVEHVLSVFVTKVPDGITHQQTDHLDECAGLAGAKRIHVVDESGVGCVAPIVPVVVPVEGMFRLEFYPVQA